MREPKGKELPNKERWLYAHTYHIIVICILFNDRNKFEGMRVPKARARVRRNALPAAASREANDHHHQSEPQNIRARARGQGNYFKNYSTTTTTATATSGTQTSGSPHHTTLCCTKFTCRTHSPTLVFVEQILENTCCCVSRGRGGGGVEWRVACSMCLFGGHFMQTRFARASYRAVSLLLRNYGV